MSLFPVIIALVIVQRLVELVIATRNTARLRAQGAIEAGSGHYPLFVLLHATWLLSLPLLLPWSTPARWVFLLPYLLLQPLRFWVVSSLGARWTTRIMVLPGEKLVRRGPYRWISHPNYLLVALEIPLLPLAFGAWQLALLFGLLNLALLAWRIRVENGALAGSVAPGLPQPGGG